MLASSFPTGSESMVPPSLLVVICSFVAAPSLLYLSVLLCTGSRRLSLALTSLAVVLCVLDPDDVSRILLPGSEPALGTAVPVASFPTETSFLSVTSFVMPTPASHTIAGLLTPLNTLFLNMSCLLVLVLCTVISQPSNNSTPRVSITTTLSSTLQPVLTLLTRRVIPTMQDIFAFVYGEAIPWLATLLLSVLMAVHDLISQAFATPGDLSPPSTNSNKRLPCSFNVDSPTSAGSRARLTGEKQTQPMLVAPGPPPRASKVDRKKVAPMSKNKRLFYATPDSMIQAVAREETMTDSDTSLTRSDNGSAWNDPPSAIFSTHPSSSIRQNRSRVTCTQSDDTQSTSASVSRVQSSFHVNPETNLRSVPKTTAPMITATSMGLSRAQSSSVEKKKRMRGRRSGVIRRSARRREPSTKSEMTR